MFFVTEALADSQGQPAMGLMGMGGNLTGMLPILFIVVFGYLLLIRPQQKKMREHKEMVNNLKRGDKVVTSGGIIGKVDKVDIEPDILLVEIASDVKVRMLKSTISEVLVKSVSEDK